jgi:cobalamin-dependent methionine synthase I
MKTADAVPDSVSTGWRADSTAAKRGCVIAGDLDYVTDPQIIPRYYNLCLTERMELFHSVILCASRAGVQRVSLYARGVGSSEADLLMMMVDVAEQHSAMDFLFHFFDERALETALRRCSRRPLLNYLSGERTKMSRMLPVLERHRCPIVVQPVDDAGMPPTAAGRMRIIERVVKELEALAFERQDIFIDCLSPSHGALPYGLRVTLETIQESRRVGLRTILWPENAGLGRHDRHTIVSTYMAMALQAGLDCAVVNLGNTALLKTIETARQMQD